METSFIKNIFIKITVAAKNDFILAIAFLLALVSCLFITPDKKYLGYIDVNTIIILFCLMLIVEALKESQLFEKIGNMILKRVKTERGIVFSLILMCFVSSMLITNDVALITFVPLGLLVLEATHMTSHLCLAVTSMTLAANLGSMLTPIGNPQNVYLFSISHTDIGQFLMTMLPYSAVSFLMLLILTAFVCGKAKVQSGAGALESESSSKSAVGKNLLYGGLFALCIASLMGFLNIYMLLLVVSFAVFLENKKLFARVDYNLLLTFICFFIFVGNINRLDGFHEAVISMLANNEKLVSVVTSQLISNVPAALLLSGYTDNLREILIGTNLGGLGTLIASMASLISYKQLVNRHPELKKRYLVTFTLLNIAFLAVLYAVSEISLI